MGLLRKNKAEKKNLLDMLHEGSSNHVVSGYKGTYSNASGIDFNSYYGNKFIPPDNNNYYQWDYKYYQKQNLLPVQEDPRVVELEKELAEARARIEELEAELRDRIIEI